MGRTKYKVYEETIRGDGSTENLDGGESFTSVYICQISSNLHFKCVQFLVPQFYVNEAIKRKSNRKKREIEPSQLKIFKQDD